MRRLSLLYILVGTVLSAAVGLAIYSYTVSNKLSNRERLVILDTMRELAAEKIVGIESEILKADQAVFDAVDIDNILEIDSLARHQRSVKSILVLDDKQKILPSGFVTRREKKAEIKRFQKLFETRVLKDLKLGPRTPTERSHLHKNYDGKPYLFSWVRKRAKGSDYFVVIETDLPFLVGTMFSQFLSSQSPRFYQVVNEEGDHVYGPLLGKSGRTVSLGFTETVSNWRLRVVQKHSGASASKAKRQVVDFSLIGTALGIIVIGLATLLIAVRRERRANELKSEFISNVSHELKTPLSIISMFGEMLASRRTKSSEQATEYAEIIWKESVRLSRLIDNVLDFAKLERGVDAVQFARGDFGAVVERAVELSWHRLTRAKMEVEVDIADDLSEVELDANALTLCVLNLIDNAIKYAADGGRLRVGLRQTDSRQVLSVTDWGPGIAVEEQTSIFDRFYRAKAMRLQPVRGSGIGLALVQHIARAHGGAISVDSEPGQGATFRLWIPTKGHG